MVGISTTSRIVRALTIFVSLLPLVAFILLNLIVNQLRYFLNIGFIVFFILTIVWFLFIMRLNYFHYDVYMDKGEMVLSRPFTKDYYENPKAVRVIPLGQLTLFLFLYKVVAPERTFLIKIPPKSFKERLNSSLVIQRFREKIDKLIEVNE